MAVVVDLDAVRRGVEAKRRGDALEQPALRGALGEPAAERLARGGEDAIDQLLFIAALRHRQDDTAAAERQRLLDQLLLGQPMAEQHQRRFWPVVVELADKRAQHVLDRELAIVAREIGAIAPILPAAEKEHLHAGLPGLLIGRDHVGIDDAGHVNVLMSLDQGEGADAVADQPRRLEIERRGGGLHLGREPQLHRAAAARQKGMRLLDQAGILLAADPPDARCAAPLDLVQQAWAGAVGKDAVAARAQQKRLLQGHQGAIDRPCRGERAEIAAALALRAAIFGQLRKVAIGGQMDQRKRFVVAQQNIEARHQPLDQIAFEQQRFCLGMGRDDLHSGGLGHHAPQSVR